MRLSRYLMNNIKFSVSNTGLEEHLIYLQEAKEQVLELTGHVEMMKVDMMGDTYQRSGNSLFGEVGIVSSVFYSWFTHKLTTLPNG